MKFLKTVTTTSAALAIAAGTLSAPAALAGEPLHFPWNTTEKSYSSVEQVKSEHSAELSTITEHEIVAEMFGRNGSNNGKGWFKLDANGQPEKNAQGQLVPDLPKKLQWLIPVYNEHREDKKVQYWTATSPSMDGKEVELAVITPTGDFNQSRPTIYLLNGAGGADQGMDWITMTDSAEENQNVVDFYLKKNVNVVIVQAGAFTYYTDWVKEPKSTYVTGKQRWETFLTKELPIPLEEKLNGNGKRAIAGMSMSATSALLLAEHNPGFYDAVGSYAGCAATTTPFPRAFANITVDRANRATVEQMWGPANGAYARYNDALINSNNLRNSALYVSTSTGIPGENEMLSSILERNGGNLSSGFQSSSTLVIEGGVIEAAVHDCTRQLKRKLDREGISADWNFRPTGTHSWPGWKEDIWKSWDTYARAFGQPTGLDRDPAIGATAATAATGTERAAAATATVDETAARAGVDLTESDPLAGALGALTNKQTEEQTGEEADQPATTE